jgi:hypothetical protein
MRDDELRTVYQSSLSGLVCPLGSRTFVLCSGGFHGNVGIRKADTVSRMPAARVGGLSVRIFYFFINHPCPLVGRRQSDRHVVVA